MNRKRLLAILILVILAAALIVFNQLLYITDTNEIRPYQRTATYIVSQNHVVETLIYETETASAEGVCECIVDFGTITPERTTEVVGTLTAPTSSG